MTTPLLSTKLYMPPARGQQVERSRLTARLSEALRPGRKLALISAPAGFGKTTMLAQGLAVGSWGSGNTNSTPQPATSSSRSIAWLALDAADNDPSGFWSYVIAALEGVCAGVADTTLPLLHAPQPVPLETVLTALLNTLARFATDICLVLDDYHQIDAQAIHRSLNFLLEHAPPHLHLIIASRADPPLSLARLRARGELVELRAADLRFTPDEAALFLRETMNLSLTAAEVAALEARTEGWIAGLQLAALAMRDRRDLARFVSAFTGSNRFVLDYLAEEVFAQQPAQIQRFLLQTAVLNRMCGPLCDAVLGLAEDERPKTKDQNDSLFVLRPSSFVGAAYSQIILDQLERANLFVIPLDDERRWYRYHHLFGEVLRERLHSGAAPAEVAALHRRASQWYAENGLIADAIQHALAAGAPDTAAQLIEAGAQPLLARGELVSLMRWLRVLPEAILRTRPRLLLLLSWVLPNTGAIADSARYLAEAEALMADNPDPLLRSEFLATRIPLLIYQDKTAEVIASSRQVLEHLPVEHFFHSLTALIMGLALFRESRLSEAVQALSYAAGVARGKQQLFLLVPSLCFLAQIAADRGDFIQADQLYEQALAECRAANGTLSPIAGMALVELGRLRWWQGRSEEAAHALEHGMELCIQLNAAGHFFLDGYTALAEIKLAQGHLVEALQQLALAEERVRDFFNPVFTATISAYRANIWHVQGDQAATTWLHDHYASLEQPLLLPREKEYVTLVRLMIDAQQYDQALAAIERLVAFAHTVGCTRGEVDLLALRAIVHLRQSDKSAAQAALDQSLALAAPMGYARIFIDESRSVAALLAQIACGDSPAARYATKLITSFPEGRLQNVDVRLKEEKPTTYYLQSAMLEPLSEREREILRQIAAGRSNQEIAATLVIAISTVKKHINNIFGKLDVQSRTQALVRARELDLL